MRTPFLRRMRRKPNTNLSSRCAHGALDLRSRRSAERDRTATVVRRPRESGRHGIVGGQLASSAAPQADSSCVDQNPVYFELPHIGFTHPSACSQHPSARIRWHAFFPRSCVEDAILQATVVSCYPTARRRSRRAAAFTRSGNTAPASESASVVWSTQSLYFTSGAMQVSPPQRRADRDRDRALDQAWAVVERVRERSAHRTEEEVLRDVTEAVEDVRQETAD